MDSGMTVLWKATKNNLTNILKLFVKPKIFFSIQELHTKWLFPFLFGFIISGTAFGVYFVKLHAADNMNYESTINEQSVINADPQILKLARPIITLLLALVVVALFVSAVFYFVFHIQGGEVTFKKIFSIYQWAFLAPLTIGSLSQIIVLFILKSNQIPSNYEAILPSNLTTFFEYKGNIVLQQIGLSIDLFSIWAIILLFIGFGSIVAMLNKKRILWSIISLWCIYIVSKCILFSTILNS